VIFASTPTRNLDPKPYRGMAGARFNRNAHLLESALAMSIVVLDPRPEYDQPRAHDANPALVDFRKMHGMKTGDALSHSALVWSASLPSMVRAGAYPRPAGLHAQEVLVRLGFLAKLAGVTA
jgi:hypothetical protein